MEHFNASFQPANATSNLTWGFARVYKIAGLQPVYSASKSDWIF